MIGAMKEEDRQVAIGLGTKGDVHPPPEDKCHLLRETKETVE
jgi:hypothetical protein